MQQSDPDPKQRDARAELEAIAFMDAPPDSAPLLNVKRAACVDLLRLDGRFREAAAEPPQQPLPWPRAETFASAEEWLKRYKPKTLE